ncbi:MAG: hypothetical protein QXT99_09150 [Candidatus Nitrosotenuis sp.]
MRDGLSQKLSQFYNSDKFSWFIIGVGIALRINRYLYNPSLWFDEARNAMFIIDRPFWEFIPPRSDHTISPQIGFLMLEKLAIQIIGYSEYALRLFPLLFGIISLFLFYKIARYYIQPKAVPVALGLFAILNPLVSLSSELKPYTGDVAIALLLYVVTIYIQSRKLTAFQIILLGGFGAIVVWFSHPSVFILLGVGITSGFSCLLKKEWPKLGRLLITFLIWISSFLVVYLIYTRHLMFNFTLTNDRIVWMKDKAFMPFPPTSLSDIQWFLDLPIRIFSFPVGLTFSGIATLTFIVGCISIFSEKKERFFILILPLIITMLASTLHKYVFSAEPILFLVPFILLFVAEGTEYIREKLNHTSKIIGIIFIGLLFLHPLSRSTYYVFKPISVEEIKPVLSHIKKNWQEGDILYVYYMSQFAFKYYSKYYPQNYHFNEDEYIIGRAPRDWYATYKRQEFKGFWNPEKPFSQPYTEIFKEYIEEMNKLKGLKRVWILFSSKVPRNNIVEENFFIYHLETIGRQLDFYRKPGASVYLYDLSSETSQIN